MARIEFTAQSGRLLVTVTLSRRNLLALLAKLELPVSLRAISSTNAYADGEPVDPVVMVVRAEPDAEHYRARNPGPMSPITETLISVEPPSRTSRR
jgi:hypothetical protein